jgi:two-component system, sensor histidine kinase
VIDDDALALKSTQSLLRSWGCHVIAADSLTVARELMANHAFVPELIVVDLHLVGMTGFEVLRQLRAALGPNVPGVLVTGDTTPTFVERAREQGQVLLRKPIDPARLRALIQRAKSN